MKKYIIIADYVKKYNYFIDKTNKEIVIERLKGYHILDDDFGYSLEEANQIMKDFKVYKKEKIKVNSPFIPKKIFLMRKTKLKKHLVKKRDGKGEYYYSLPKIEIL